MNLKDKIVLITGSSRGIGLEIAKEFAKKGANIILNARRKISQDLINEIKAYEVNCIGVSADISNLEQVSEMFKIIEDEMGTVDILVNNAGIVNDSLFVRMKEQDFANVVDVNLTGTFNVSQPVFKKMIKKREGVIINLSSVSALMGNIGQANYAASKAGIIAMTKSLAREGASRNVRVNAIAPGFIDTDMVTVLSDKAREQVEKDIPLNRFGQAEDIAQAAIFLVENNYVTGQVINIDGGLVMNG